MFETYLNNRLFTLFICPLILGSLTVFSFQPFNLSAINFLILPIFFYLIVYIKKKSKSVYRKKPFKKIYFYLEHLLDLDILFVEYIGSRIHLPLIKTLNF